MPDYPWPASAITREHMAALHKVRESTQPRVPITRLIAQAIEQAYGDEASSSHQSQTKEAA